MIVDHKSRDVSTSKTLPPPEATSAISSKSERKLSVELPVPRHIYTVGSTVSGIVHLGTKDIESIQEVQVSLVCVVRSIYYLYLGGSSQDYRCETTNLIHRDQTLWSHQEGGANIPADMAFQITIPEVGNDKKANNPNAPLPPSFHAGKPGWKDKMTQTPFGFVKYHIKVAVVRKGILKRKERAFCPFLFLPPSPPPPLLPTPPETISGENLCLPNDTWDSDSVNKKMHHAIFSSNGQATLVLWLPRVPSFSRLTRIPFVLHLLQTRRAKGTSNKQPSGDSLPPAAQIDKASMYLEQKIRSCAKGGVQHHTRTYDKVAIDNLLHGITPQESPWSLKKRDGEAYWEKGYIWRGLWTFKETPSFDNRQLTWKYALVAEVPVKGVGNTAKLVSRDLEVTSGVEAGTNIVMAPGGIEDMLVLPPDYFDIDALHDDDDMDEKV